VLYNITKFIKVEVKDQMQVQRVRTSVAAVITVCFQNLMITRVTNYEKL
jgi:hypothetical protein